MQSAVNSAASRMIISQQMPPEEETELNCAVLCSRWEDLSASACRHTSTALLQTSPANRTGFHHKHSDSRQASRRHGQEMPSIQINWQPLTCMYVPQQITEPSYSHDTNKQTTRPIDRFCSHLLSYNLIWKSVHIRSHSFTPLYIICLTTTTCSEPRVLILIGFDFFFRKYGKSCRYLY